MTAIHRPICIDIYHGDEVSDSPTPLAGLDRAKGAGIFALIHKASEGVSGRDPRYDRRREKWMSGPAVTVPETDGSVLKLPPVFGAYHFFHGQDPVAEAGNFLMTARLENMDMPFVDWEAVGASGYHPSAEMADVFCSEVEERLGRACGVYGGNVPREAFDRDCPPELADRFAARPLWFCSYGRAMAALPLPWRETTPLLWQDDGDRYGPGPHAIPGISGYCDNSTVVDPVTVSKLYDLWTGA